MTFFIVYYIITVIINLLQLRYVNCMKFNKHSQVDMYDASIFVLLSPVSAPIITVIVIVSYLLKALTKLVQLIMR